LRLRSDERLARQSAAGDTDAFAALYERHHRSLYRYCRSIVADPDDAADALQSTMTRALAAIGSRDEAAPVRAWFFRIAHNESISLIRRRRTAEPLEPDSAIGPDVAADAELRGRLTQLVSDLQELTERQRGALLMRELGGLSHVEIAAALEVSVGAVKQSIFEARTALHDYAAGREMECRAVQRQLSDGDGRTARSRALRAHLRSCAACSAFRDGLKARTGELAAIAPVLPAATAAAVLEGVIGGGGGTGGGGLLAGLLGGGISKSVAVGAATATVTAGAGTATYTVTRPDEPPPRERKAAVSAPVPHEPKEAVLGAVVEEDRSEAGKPEPRTDAAESPQAPERRTAEREPARSTPRIRPVTARTTPVAADAPEPADREPSAQTPRREDEARDRVDDDVEAIEDDGAKDDGSRGRGPNDDPSDGGDDDPDPGRATPPVKTLPPAAVDAPSRKPAKAPAVDDADDGKAEPPHIPKVKADRGAKVDDALVDDAN
jgi:RNA polymerase sigma factor (sigma-70 family)